MPWGRLDDSLYDHPKLDEFPSDEPTLRRVLDSMSLEDLVRLAGLGLWARSISYSNRHLTDGLVSRSAMERKLHASRELAEIVTRVGLFEPTSTGFLVHDFLEFNDSRASVLERREADARRQRDWREKRRQARHGVTDGVTPNGDASPVTPGVTASVTKGVTASSRARESRPGPTRPDPARSLSREDPARKADIAALHELGWATVSRPQRKVLAEIADRHRRDGNDGTWFAAEAIRAAGDADPLEAVMTADRLWQEAQRRRADAEEAAWAETKAADVPDWARRTA